MDSKATVPPDAIFAFERMAVPSDFEGRGKKNASRNSLDYSEIYSVSVEPGYVGKEYNNEMDKPVAKMEPNALEMMEQEKEASNNFLRRFLERRDKKKMCFKIVSELPSGIRSFRLLYIERVNLVVFFWASKFAHNVPVKVFCARTDTEEFTEIASLNIASRGTGNTVLHHCKKGKKTLVFYLLEADGLQKIHIQQL